MDNYGFVITKEGWSLFAKLIAGTANLDLLGVAFGKGRLPEGTNPATLEALISPVADGSTTGMTITKKTNDAGEITQVDVSFIAEYRSTCTNDNVTGVRAIDITEGVYINEYGVFAKDPDTQQPIMIYYATLGDYPQYVTSFSDGAVDVRRFPITIVLTSDLNVQVLYPQIAFMTYENTVDYVMNEAKPVIMAEVEDKISKHNVDTAAHLDLRFSVKNNKERIAYLEDFLMGEAKSFVQNFDSINDVSISSGIWNEAEQRLEF